MCEVNKDGIILAATALGERVEANWAHDPGGLFPGIQLARVGMQVRKGQHVHFFEVPFWWICWIDGSLSVVSIDQASSYRKEREVS